MESTPHAELPPATPLVLRTIDRDHLTDRIWRHGASTLTDAELVAVLIRQGHGPRSAVDVAHTLLQRCGGSLLMLNRLTAWELAQHAGMGRTKAAIVLAATELGRRRHCLDPTSRPLVATSAAAYEMLRPVLQDLTHEEFWLLLLDRGNRLIERVRISIGGLHGTVADPKMIFKAALDRRASAVVLAHNHPSGQLRPSEEDMRLTTKLVEGARFLDIAAQDHLIVTALGYFSFSDQGMMR